jgi:tryptophan halogenase
MKKQISIVGGGAAGWLSALYIQNLYKDDADITLIESEDIGILGAGEASVPFTIQFLKKLNINIDELIVAVNGTHKIGITFENWNGDGNQYIHDFASGDVRKYKLENYIGYLLDNGLDVNHNCISKRMAYANKAPFTKDNIELLSHSFHFDTNLLASYLRKIAESRGVIRIDGIVNSFTQNEYGDVTNINLENGKSIKTNFVFDCSGFARLIIGKLYKTQWISYKDRLTVNSALTFQLPQDIDNIKPYTRAVAMKYGWMWQIPLQNRIGCGYVFDNNYINEIEAKAEVESLLGYEIQSNRVLEFDAGRYNSVWVNNCIAVGLSSGFLEPLEATSIVMSAISLESLTRFDLDYKNYERVGNYNMNIASITNNIMEFIYYHYITQRKDTDFWEFYTKQENISNYLQKIMNSLHSDIHIKSFNDSIFSLQNWVMIGHGLGLITNDTFIKKYKESGNIDAIQNFYKNEVIKKSNELFQNVIDESQYLKNIKKKYD